MEGHLVELPRTPVELSECVPELVGRLIGVKVEWGAASRVDEEGVERWGTVPIGVKGELPEGLKEDLPRIRGTLEAALSGDSSEMIAVCLSRLALHCRLPDLSETEYALLMDDYVEDLRDFPPAAVHAVCRAWRRSSRFWPHVSELRERLSEKVSDWRLGLTHLQHIERAIEREERTAAS